MKLGILTVTTGSTLAECCESVYTFEGSWGEQVVRFPVEDPELVVPLGVPIWLSFDESGLVGGDPLFVLDPRGSEEAALPLGQRKDVRVAIFKVMTAEEYAGRDVEEEQRVVDYAAQACQKFWRKQGGRFWNIKVRGYVMPLADGDRLPDKSRYCKSSIAAFDEHKSFDPQYFHLWGNTSASYCGWGQRPGKYSMTFSTCGWRTMCHEMGHNFGLAHSNSEHGEYGDKWCVMGRGTNLNVVHRLALGFEETEEYITLNKSRRFLMAPLHLHKEDLHPGMFQAVKFSRGSRNYALAMNSSTSLAVYQIETKPIHLHSITVGKECAVEDVTISFEKADFGYAIANVDFGDGHGNQKVSIPSGLPPATGHESPSEAHRGIFYHSWTSGQGFDIQIDSEGSQGVLYWYTYNDKKGNLEKENSQRFYWMPFKCGVTTDLPLYSCDDAGKAEIAGTGRLSFMDDDCGVFHYRIQSYKGSHINGSEWLERLTFSHSERQGVFVSEKDSTTALSVSMHGPHMAAFLTRIGPRKLDHVKRPIKNAITNQQWFLMTGLARGLSMDLSVVRTEEGYLGEHLEPLFIDAGQATIAWDDGSWIVTFEGNTYKMRRLI
jgi:hypothetical protein